MNQKQATGIELGKALKTGSVRALARLITCVERGSTEAEEAVQYLYPETGRAYILGITGPAGSGKSSLVDQLTAEMRQNHHTVGILACDPTSPFTGGAILGDRLRMQHVMGDPEVYIRSLGTRGHLGGLPKAASNALHLLDAFGKDFILVETVGVGQDEVEVVQLADTCAVVMVPGLGDDIQAIKAGIMEIGDIFIVNKADRPGADRVVDEIQGMLHLKQGESDWDPPVIKTVAIEGKGMGQVLEAVNRHRRHLDQSGQLDAGRKERAKMEVIQHMSEEIHRHVLRRIRTEVDFDKYMEEVFQRRKDPHTLSQELMWPITRHL